MMNLVILVGNVGADPTTRSITSGETTVKTATVRLATSKRWRDRNGENQESTEWHQLSFWRRNAEFAEKYIRKGMMLQVTGELHTRKWDDQSGNTHYTTEILVESVQILTRKSDGAAQAAAPAQEAAQVEQPEYLAPAEDVDPQPFPGPDLFEP